MYRKSVNTSLYKKVLALARELLEAAQIKSQPSFNSLYQQLKDICDSHEHGKKNHPVQWEALADFTEEGNEALRLYYKALGLAITTENDECIASISYAMALLITQDSQLHSDENGTHAKVLVLQAKDYAAKTGDTELQREIQQLLKVI